MFVSLRLVAAGSLLGIVLGVALGAWMAVRQYRMSDRVTTLASLIIISTPTVVIAVVLQLLAIKYNQATGSQFFEFLGETGRHGDTALSPLWDRLQHLLLPTLTLLLIYAATYSRIQRNLMLDTLGADYVRTARPGRRKAAALRKHAGGRRPRRSSPCRSTRAHPPGNGTYRSATSTAEIVGVSTCRCDLTDCLATGWVRDLGV
ncbi:ABC transporter permease subunit [Georgenia sp. SUBG003]|uniref:ABC transporter permease subunit n=1 Tax=Georgenia sp. SUBG003 TaxID=1497974 RepID=UPI003AB3F860